MGKKNKVRYPVERNKIACYRCRKLKKKCSTTQPCSNCSKVGAKYDHPLESNRKPASNKYVSSLLKRIEVLSETLDKQNLIRSSERTFLFEKSDNSAQQYEDTDPDFLGLNDIWRLKFENSKFCFLGPSSGRNYEINNTINRNSLNDVTKNGLSEPLSMDLHHMEHFKWYFGKINTQIHIVSEDLFFSSLSADNNTFGPFASNALINAIFAITILKGPFVLDYKVFKDLARVQVFHEISDLRITSVQTLALLSMIEMNDGNESQASVFIAMACSLSNHLGLHINLNHLVENKSMSQEELNLRQLLFWSCFFIDRIRCPI